MTNKDVTQFIADCRADGLEVEMHSSGGHHVITSPSSPARYTIPATPSDHKSMENARASVRRIFDVPMRSKQTRSRSLDITADDIYSVMPITGQPMTLNHILHSLNIAPSEVRRQSVRRVMRADPRFASSATKARSEFDVKKVSAFVLTDAEPVRTTESPAPIHTAPETKPASPPERSEASELSDWIDYLYDTFSLSVPASEDGKRQLRRLAPLLAAATTNTKETN